MDWSALVVDLKGLVRVRREATFRSQEFPALEAVAGLTHAGEANDGHGQVTTLVRDAVTQIPDESERIALECLLTDRHGPRWVPLGTRRDRVQTETDDEKPGSQTKRISVHRLARRLSDGTNYEEELLGRVATSVLAIASELDRRTPPAHDLGEASDFRGESEQSAVTEGPDAPPTPTGKIEDSVAAIGLNPVAGFTETVPNTGGQPVIPKAGPGISAPSEPSPVTRGENRQRALRIGAVAVAIAVLGLVIWTTTSNEPGAPEAAVAGQTQAPECPIELIGDRETATEAIQAVEDRMSEPFECPAMDGDDEPRLPGVAVQHLGELDGTEAWVLIAEITGGAVVVPDQAWVRYLKRVSEYGAGSVGSIDSWKQDGPLFVMQSSTGWRFVAENAHSLYFSVSPTIAHAWQSNRDQLGQPMMSNIRDGYQEFAGGRISKSGQVETQERLALDDAPGTPDSLIRQPAGTSWWIDANRRRWWIPDGTVWGCKGGDPKMTADNLTGREVASHPYGGIADCAGGTE